MKQVLIYWEALLSCWSVNNAFLNYYLVVIKQMKHENVGPCHVSKFTERPEAG